ncbi:methyltransferase [Microbulbifer variabilis]|uniref:methyltransferase n=1 Tax=Microbulbifer variabilis TaxID=266805 RepID=UPI001CFE7CD1|nr:methyltransferase [Microbulbifer variabilis]
MHIKAPTTSDAPQWDRLMGNYTFACVMVAAQLDIYGLIEEGYNTSEKLARKLQLSHKGINHYLLILNHLGYIRIENNQFKNTKLAKNYLDKTSPYYWGEVLLDPFAIYDINHLDKKILTSLKREYELECKGRSVTDMWQNDEMDNESAAAFTHLMHSQGFASAVKAASNGIFKSVNTLLDAGAGSGTIALAFCDAYPDRNALLFDLGPVCEAAKEYVEKFNKKEQITVVKGDLFSSDWPTGFDGICFSNVLHDWQEATCENLLSKAFSLLPKGGHIFIHDMLLDESQLTPSLFSFHLFMNHGSQLFSEQQLVQLLTKTGFKNPQCHKALGYFSVVSAQKA